MRDSYNSSIFTSISANKFQASIVSEYFIDGDDWCTTAHDSWSSRQICRNNSSAPEAASLRYLQAGVSTLSFLDHRECTRSFGSPFASKYGDVLLVASDPSIPVETIYTREGEWVCLADQQESGSGHSHCTVLLSTTGWSGVAYCLATKTPERCKVSLSARLLFTVIICNAVKVICLATLALGKREPLFTIGDCIASFLQYTDRFTSGIPSLSCWHIYQHFPNWPRREDKSAKSSYYGRHELMPLRREPLCYRMWASGVGPSRWLILLPWLVISEISLRYLES